MTPILPNIAITGRTGSGKSTAAAYLETRYRYAHARPGAACRQIAQRLFDTEAKTVLNQINDAMRAIDPNVWLRVALSEAPAEKPIVVDGMRFQSNIKFLRERGFVLVKIEAHSDVRLQRLKARNQDYDPNIDEQHSSETEIENENFDYVIQNDENDPTLLYEEIDRIILGNSVAQPIP